MVHGVAWLVAGAALMGCGEEGMVGDTGNPGNPPSPFPSVASFDAAGPYPTVTDDSLADCTLHFPESLGEGDVQHPIVLWGNGTTAVPIFYAGVLDHLASHGFVVAAANTTNAGSGAEMLACLDGVVQRNASATDAFFGRLDTARVGATGHSQGGAGSLMAGADPRVATTAPLQPYIDPIPFGGAFESTSLGSQTGPMLLFSGEVDDIAPPEAQQRRVFEGANGPVWWATLRAANHFEPVGDAGRYRAPLTAWFRSQLMNDPEAAAWFEDPCTLCEDPDWQVQTR